MYRLHVRETRCVHCDRPLELRFFYSGTKRLRVLNKDEGGGWCLWCEHCERGFWQRLLYDVSEFDFAKDNDLVGMWTTYSWHETVAMLW